jgi:pimeloyl-ACP methyl ester carboxylesterase
LDLEIRPRLQPGDQDQAKRVFSSVADVPLPTLVIRGERSDVVDAEAAAELGAFLPDGRVATVPDPGHNIHRDNPVGLAQALLAFEAEIGAGRT